MAEIRDLLNFAVFVLAQTEGPGASNCWQDLGASPFATPVWIAVNRSCRKSERSSQFPLAPKRCVIVFPLPQSQTKPTSKGLRDAAQLDRHRSRSFGARIASQPLCPRSADSAPAAHGKGAQA